MTKKYNQLTLEQRYKIEALKNSGHSQSFTASHIGVSKSTISRELKRNTPQRGVGAKVYTAKRAQENTDIRHKHKPKQVKFSNELKEQAKKWMLEKHYSPELVSAQWKKDGVEGVSHETIYKFVWECKHTYKRCNRRYKKLYKALRHGRRRRKRGNYKDSRGLIPNRVSIEKRPKIVEKRKRLGDLEADLIMGKAHKSALLVTTDRATLKTTIDKLTGKDPHTVSKKLIKRLKQMPLIKTITFDNDQAFSHHEKIAEETGAKTYFTRPYTSQEKGTVENRNGLIRWFFPKQTDFREVALREIKKVENEINNRPIRKFGYKTANEVFLKLKGSVALMS